MGSAKSGKRRDPSKTYEGTPCRRFGHTTRYINGDGCVECQSLDHKANPEKRREADARHRANPDNTINLRYLKNRYGITEEEYWAMHKAQGGVCAICEQPPSGRWPRLHVDHDHKTGPVRGLLCFNCNAALGNMDDDPARLLNAAAYLRKHAVCTCGFDEALAAYRRGEETPGWDWMGDPGHSSGCPRI